MSSVSLRRFLAPCAVACIAFLPLAACQTTGVGTDAPSSNSTGGSDVQYGLFFDQADHLDQLIAEGDFDKAAKLYEDHQAFFAKNWEKAKPGLAKVALHFKAAHTPGVETALSAVQSAEWPADRADWPRVREALERGKAALRAIPDHALLNVSEFAFAEADALRAAVAKLDTAVSETAPADFAAFDHFGPTSFFSVHPYSGDPSQFVDAHFASLDRRLETASATQIGAFAGNYTEALLGKARWSRLGATMVAKLMKTGKGEPSLKAAVSAIRDARDAGFTIDKVPGIKIGFVEATSRSLLNQRALDFPVQVDLDLPFEVMKASLDEVLSAPKTERPDYLVVIDVALAKAERRISSAKKKPSRVLVGYRTEPNPDYTTAQTAFSTAQMNFQTANTDKIGADAQYCYGLGCMGKLVAQMAAAGKLTEAKKAMTEATEKLNGTPMTVNVPVYEKYNYSLATVKARKAMTTHYYVLDLRRDRLYKSTFDLTDRKTFEVAYQVDEDDPDKETHYASASPEADVDAWEEAGASVKMSELMFHYLADAGATKPLPSLTALRKQMLKDKNKALAALKDRTFEGSTKNDPRFDSVVVVYMPDGGLGSGFFVKPDVVMTNYHVVEDGKFVELKLHGGKETFGKVIAKDIRLDLALIKVQERGKPVSFFADTELDLGSTVEVIGHPRRLEFSITRGVVSAVREMAPVNINSNDKVLHVQIDAPTSPGNSGGPVFVGRKVVSVVSFGRVDKGSQNLNFTVHYSEALRFLSETLGS